MGGKFPFVGIGGEGGFSGAGGLFRRILYWIFPLYKTEDKLLIGRDKIPIGVIDKIIKKEELLPTSSESCLLISLAPRFPFKAYQTLNLFYFDNQYLFSVFQSNYNFHTHSCFDSQYILSLSWVYYPCFFSL